MFNAVSCKLSLSLQDTTIYTGQLLAGGGGGRREGVGGRGEGEGEGRG